MDSLDFTDLDFTGVNLPVEKAQAAYHWSAALVEALVYKRLVYSLTTHRPYHLVSEITHVYPYTQ